MIRATLRRLLSFLDHGRRSVLVLVSASVVAGVAEGAAILVVVRVAVDLASDQVQSDFVPFVFGATGAGTALAIAGFFAITTLVAHLAIARESAAVSSQVLNNSRSRALRAFTAASWPTQSAQRTGSLQETVSTLSLLASAFTQVIAAGVANLIMLVMFLALAFTVNPLGMAIVTGTGLAIFAIIRPLGNRTRESGAAFTRADASFAEDTANFASSAMELRAFGVGGVAEQQLESNLRDVAEKQRSVRFRSALGTTLYRDIAVLLLIAAVGVLTLLDRDSVGSVSAVVVLVIRALASAHAVNAMIHAAHERAPVVELLEERIIELEAGEATVGTHPLESVSTVRLDGVGYRYPDGVDALSDVSIAFGKGEAVGIVGPSGSGKTTLVQLLLGLRRPTSGDILVNGHSYEDYSPESWARHVAYVPQEPTLFEGTVADNIGFYRGVDRATIEQAAVQANVADEIAALPDGFDTVLGPGGTGLSGGQKQRVAIARALAGDPEVLIMDEPSSALDPRSEGLLADVVGELARRKAVIIVAHRASTLALCNRLVTIEHGRLVSDRSIDPGSVPPPAARPPAGVTESVATVPLGNEPRVSV